MAVRTRLSHKRVLNIQHSELTEICKPRHSSAAFNLSPRHQCSPECSPARPTHRRLTATPESRRKRTRCAARSSLYSLSRVSPRPPLSRTSIGRERGRGRGLFQRGDRECARRLFRGRAPGRVRAPPACRVPAQSSARSRWRAASSPSGVWLYVAREWRQNSNEQAQLEARLLPAASQVRPGRTGRLRIETGPEFCSVRRPRFMIHSRSWVGWLAGV